MEAQPRHHDGRRASMRPRSKTAENGPLRRRGHGLRHRFNEAAVEDRGKLASIIRANSSLFGFNEAAVEDRGKRPATLKPWHGVPPSFNEAAVEDRGKLAGHL